MAFLYFFRYFAENAFIFEPIVKCLFRFRRIESNGHTTHGTDAMLRGQANPLAEICWGGWGLEEEYSRNAQPAPKSRKRRPMAGWKVVGILVCAFLKPRREIPRITP